MHLHNLVKPSDVPDDIVNATMTELAFLLLFTVGILTYFIGNTIGGSKLSCLYEYSTNGQRLTKERAVIKVILYPDKIVRTKNINDQRHINVVELLVGENIFKWLHQSESYAYSDLSILLN